MEYKEQLDTLRQQMPIGIRHGLELLRKTNGDIVAARTLFEEELIAIIISKTSVSQETAQKHLQAANYDMPKTLVSIDEERFSLPERILRNAKNREEALSLLARNLADAKGIKRNYWLPLDQLQHLSPVQRCLLVVMEWLEYEDYEGFDHGIYFYVDIVVTQHETMLLLPDVAASIRLGRNRSDALMERYKNKPSPGKKQFHVGNVINKDKKFVRTMSIFKENRMLIIDRLYEIATNNIAVFY
ncbi:MAG: hypothetical protein J7623_10155 [Chitinophaga sp.]|uniref:hypothetical protein n=1 Tax=Chitinophaga sp. TaxID=1869181 RepID=UPI001B224D58|nr:hypothetical protein [Chitinophaga sp.]MBO9728983.1 hypothetical protein [Chitinophaga sp.]